jgi:SAM-dependent methyltransferase
LSRHAFTGERLHPGSDLFAVDLARHSAAYRFAAELAGGKRVLDLGCGSGYGTAELAGVSLFVVGVDRVAPDAAARSGLVRYLRADLARLPLLPASFDLVVSLQVIEHLDDPTEYLAAMARLLRPGGAAVLTTPNRLTSDGENPYHLHEYVAEELERLLRGYFMEVEIKGVGATPPVARYLEARLRRIRLLTSLDPLGLRRSLPRPLLEWVFARLAVVLRRSIRRREGLPEATWKDFPIGRSEPTCLDILAVCRRPTREVR